MPTNAHESVVAALGRTLRLGLGSAVLTAGSGGRVIGGHPGLHAPGQPLPAEAWIDFAVGLADVALEAAERTAAGLADALRPASRLVGTPLGQLLCQAQALIGPLVQPITERGRQRRLQAEQEAAAAAEALLPVATEVMMGKVDLRRMLEVSLEAVDMGTALDMIDLDHAMAATAERIDLTDIALQYIDMTRVMDAAMRSVDVAALLRGQLEGVDLQDLIISTPTNLAGEALRTTTRLVGGAAERGRWVRSLGAAALENGRAAGVPTQAVGGVPA